MFITLISTEFMQYFMYINICYIVIVVAYLERIAHLFLLLCNISNACFIDVLHFVKIPPQTIHVLCIFYIKYKQKDIKTKCHLLYAPCY